MRYLGNSNDSKGEKRKSIQPSWMEKRRLKEEQLKLANEIPEILNENKDDIDKISDEIKDAERYSNEEIYSNYYEPQNTPFEKVIFRNTVTRSVEKIDINGEINKAVEINEQVEERVKFGHQNNNIFGSDFFKDNVFENDFFNINEQDNQLEMDKKVFEEIVKLTPSYFLKNINPSEQINNNNLKYLPLNEIIKSENINDVKEIVFVCSSQRIPNIDYLEGFKAVNIPFDENGYCVLNMIKSVNMCLNIIVEKDGYFDEKFIRELRKNHKVIVIEPRLKIKSSNFEILPTNKF